MKVGISTASFFKRLNNEEALPLLNRWGIPCTEMFFTSFSEYEPRFAEALSAVFTLERAVNSALAGGSWQSAGGEAVLACFRKFDRVLAVFDVDAAASQGAAELPPEIMALAERRVEARKAKDFKTADAIRDELKAQGWVIVDTPRGPEVRKA